MPYDHLKFEFDFFKSRINSFNSDTAAFNLKRSSPRVKKVMTAVDDAGAEQQSRRDFVNSKIEKIRGKQGQLSAELRSDERMFAIRPGPELKLSIEERTATLAEFKNEIAKLQDKLADIRAHDAINTDDLNRALALIPRDATITDRPHKLTDAEKANCASPAKAKAFVQNIRADIVKVKAELTVIDNASLPPDVAKARSDAFLDDLAGKYRIKTTGTYKMWADASGQRWQGNPDFPRNINDEFDGFATMLAVKPILEMIKQQCRDNIDAAQITNPVPRDKRRPMRAEVVAKKWLPLEYLEQAVIAYASSEHGVDIPQREDCWPLAVLGIDFVANTEPKKKVGNKMMKLTPEQIAEGYEDAFTGDQYGEANAVNVDVQPPMQPKNLEEAGYTPQQSSKKR